MEELLKQLMNRGFLIYQNGAKFVLAKVPTPADTRSAITNEIQPDTSQIEFESYQHALDKSKDLIVWKESETVPHQHAKTCWRMQMMYAHYGLGTQFVELGEMGPVSYQAAFDEATKRAKAFADSSENIEQWEVRARPFQKSPASAQNGPPVQTANDSGSIF